MPALDVRRSMVAVPFDASVSFSGPSPVGIVLRVGLAARLRFAGVARARERLAALGEDTRPRSSADGTTRLGGAAQGGDRRALPQPGSLVEIAEPGSRRSRRRSTSSRREAARSRTSGRRSRAIGESSCAGRPEGRSACARRRAASVTALRAPHVRGSWGEMQLERVVELAGMLDHCDFVTQDSTRDDDGSLLRPDLVVTPPGRARRSSSTRRCRSTAYLDAVESDDTDAASAPTCAPRAQMRDHIGKLGQKRVLAGECDSPEFVVMFVDEGLYRAALDQDGSLLEAGIDERRHRRLALDADRAPAHRRATAGSRSSVAENARPDRRPRPRAVRAARRLRRALRQGRAQPRHCGERVQPGRQLVRDAPARDARASSPEHGVRRQDATIRPGRRSKARRPTDERAELLALLDTPPTPPKEALRPGTFGRLMSFTYCGTVRRRGAL